jgi:hypothetical protein
MITIDGLTLKQVSMLDHMWAINSHEDLLEWQESLSYEDRQMSETLLGLVILAEIDDMLSNKETHVDAAKLISKIKKAIKNED